VLLDSLPVLLVTPAQSEERTLWQVPDVYMRMSPFMVSQQLESSLVAAPVHNQQPNKQLGTCG
jgi:hypothetical protein